MGCQRGWVRQRSRSNRRIDLMVVLILVLSPSIQEAVCSVVLKTLSQALKDGDKIECVIRETRINQDGRTTGITMPNHEAQEAHIRSTYERAGLDINNPRDRCQFFEAHGKYTEDWIPWNGNK